MVKYQQNPIGYNYVLTMEQRGAERLKLLHEIYGPATERVCLVQGGASPISVAVRELSI